MEPEASLDLTLSIGRPNQEAVLGRIHNEHSPFPYARMLTHNSNRGGSRNFNNRIKIYEELKSCTSYEKVQSLKKKLEYDGSSKESNANEELKLWKRTREIEDSFLYVEELKILIEETKGLALESEFPDGLTIDEEVIVRLPATSKLEGENFQININEVWACLMKNDFSIMGVLGMGGVGKTTLLKHVYNGALENPKNFGYAYWVTVSKDCSIHKLQSNIAKCVGREDIPKEEYQLKRSGMLMQALTMKDKFILFLDYMWNYVDLLEKVGIPEKSGCHVILIIQSREVCNQMMCDEIIEVDPLLEEEAWNLFVKFIGHEIAPSIVKIAEDVVKECAGLPLGIVTLARSLRKCNDICGWKNVLKNFRKSKLGVSAMEEEVFRILKFSYDRLNDLVEECFLYCATYPEDYIIEREALIWVLIGKGLFACKEIIEEMVNEGHSILNKLIRACMKLTYFPDKEEWTEDLEVVSLMQNKILGSPHISTNCPNLSILFLRENSDLSLPDSFFEQLHGLKVLDLSYSSVRVLPNSISYLKNLTTLLLIDCGECLRDIPSLANLIALTILDLSGTGITKVPEGLERLINLAYLKLQAPLKMEMFPVGILPRLSRLEYMLPLNSHLPSAAVTAQELITLKKLQRFEGWLLGIREFNDYVKYMNECGGPTNKYVLLIAYEFEGKEPRRVYFEDRFGGIGYCEVKGVELPKNIQELHFLWCDDMTSLHDVPSLYDTTLEICEIHGCEGMEYVYSFLGSPTIFSQLKKFVISSCPNIKKLFTMELLQLLQNIQEIDVSYCEKLEEIIVSSSDQDSDEEEVPAKTFVLPSLRSLRLYILPELRRICSSRLLICLISHQCITVEYCPKLQRKPSLIKDESLILSLSERFNRDKYNEKWTQL